MKTRTQSNSSLNYSLGTESRRLITEKNGKINIRLFQMKNDLVRLEIEDNGLGVAAETQEKIFSPNFTTKSSGTGLGLAMCKDIIENAGGNIGFTSSPTIGACFWIEMPLNYSMPFCDAKMALAT